MRQGAGIAQWYEHGRPIDRFEGVFERGRRMGLGRYYWPAGQRFEGYYAADLPNGQGTITIDEVAIYRDVASGGVLRTMKNSSQSVFL